MDCLIYYVPLWFICSTWSHNLLLGGLVQQLCQTHKPWSGELPHHTQHLTLQILCLALQKTRQCMITEFLISVRTHQAVSYVLPKTFLNVTSIQNIYKP